nr:hypothetical protein CDL12_07226 [Ipomoea batatas]GMC64809.1 hypothetical protein CDL12_07226 [Ipomoea batatas]
MCGISLSMSSSSFTKLCALQIRVGLLDILLCRRSGWRHHCRRSIMLNVTSKAVTKASNLQRDIGSGRLTFSVEFELRGQIEMMKIIRKNRVVMLECWTAV